MIIFKNIYYNISACVLNACVLLLLLLSNTVKAQSDWRCECKSRKSITVDNSNGQFLNDFQVRVNLPYQTDMNANFSDVRFTDSDEKTDIPYYIEYKTDGTSAVIWVKVSNIPAGGTKKIYLYYNGCGDTTTSNGEDTFVFFDDMDSDAGWNNINTDQDNLIPSTLDGATTLKKSSNCDPRGGWKSIGTILTDFRLITREQRETSYYTSCSLNRYGLENSGFNGYTINRDANKATGDRNFSYERRQNGGGGNPNRIKVLQPYGNWYRTELRRCSATNYNEAVLYDDNRIELGLVGGTITNHDYTNFDRVTIRGGFDYHIDFMAVARYNCNPPLSTINDDLIELNLPNTIKPSSGGFKGTTYCQGEQNMQLTYNADDDNAYPYTITYKDETNGTTHQQVINGQGEETFTVATVPTAKGKHRYILQSIKNKYGCVNTATIQDAIAEITVRGYPKDVLSISLDTQTICSSETSPVITLTNSDTKNIIVTYTINSGNEQTIEVDAETTINVPTTSAGLFTYNFTKVRYKSNPTCEDIIDIKKCIAVFPKNDTAPAVNNGAGTITVTPPTVVAGFNIEYSFDDGVTWGANTPPAAENCDGYKIKTRYKLTDTSCITTQTLTCSTSPATTRIVDITKPTFTAEAKSYCVRSLTSATYVDTTTDIKPEEREDYYIIKQGETDLDISSLNDNCCAESELNLSWIIKDGAIEKFSGTGQPSIYASDIKLEGNISTNKIYTITYTLEDCNGNQTIKTVNITIKPRPQIIKN